MSARRIVGGMVKPGLLALALSLALTAHVIPAPAGQGKPADAQARDIKAPPRLARGIAPVSDFLATLGVNLHAVPAPGYHYPGQYLPYLYAGGWRHVRTNFLPSIANDIVIRDIASHGIAVALTSDDALRDFGGYDRRTGAAGNVKAAAQRFVRYLTGHDLASSVAEILGPNEIENNYRNWPHLIPRWMKALHAALEANPATAHIRIVSPNFANPGDRDLWRRLGTLKASVDMGDIHSSGGIDDSAAADIGNDSWFGLITNEAESVAGKGKPLLNSESGWSDGPTCPGDGPPHFNPAPPWVNALMIMQHYFEMYRWGIVSDDVYELMNQGSDGCYENDFGFLTVHGKPKLRYRIFTAFTKLLADTGKARPAPLAYSLSGATPYTRSLMFRKTDGSYWLAVWEQREIWSANTIPKRFIKPPPPEARLEISLPERYDFTIYRPVDQNGRVNGTRALRSVSGVRALSFTSEVGVTLIEIRQGRNHENRPDNDRPASSQED
jgi:hypothetical protein